MKYDDTATDVLDERPACDLCVERMVSRGMTREAAEDYSRRHRPAAIDGRTTMGPWAFMCIDDYDRYGVGLGMGKGQRLLIDP